MNDTLPLRITYVCGKYGRLIAVILVALSALLSAGAVMAEPPAPQQETVQTNEQRVTTTLTAAGEVTSDSALYDEGETVSNSPVYLLPATPNLTLNASTTVPSDRPVTVTQQIVMLVSIERQGTVFWTDREVLANGTQTVTDGSARTTTTLDVANFRDERLSELRAQTSGVGTVRVRISANASYDTGTYSGRTNLSSPLEISDRSFEFDSPRRAERSHSTPEVRNVTASAGGSGTVASAIGVPGRSVWLLFAGVLSLVTGIAVRVVDIRIDDFETFERHYESVRYTEWISRGRVPDSGEYARIPVEGLVDLVDIAIDSEKRVIYDTQQEYYAVVDGNHIYEFRDQNDAPGRMYEFGLAPIDGEPTPAEQALQEAEAAVASDEGDVPSE